MSELFSDSIDSKQLPEMRSEFLALRRFVHDFVDLTALPTQWKDYEPIEIAESAAAALAPMVGAEFVYVSVLRDEDQKEIDVIKAAEGMKGDDLDAITAALRISVRHEDAEPSITIDDPLGGGSLRLAIAPIGGEGRGYVVAGGLQSQFPTEAQRFLLDASASDITLALERWRTGTEMRRFAALVERSSDLVAIAELGGRARYLNPAGMNLVGIESTQQVRTKQMLEFLEDLIVLNKSLETEVAQRTAELADANRMLVVRTEQHDRLDARLREAHHELNHASRLNTAGQMAAALAHELNQPVTAITNYLGAARRLLARGTPGGVVSADGVMSEALEQSLRAGTLVNRLRIFLNRGDLEVRVEKVATMIEEACALALIGFNADGVELQVRLDPAAPLVLADRTEIEQVLINLMLNALNAMQGMGRRPLSLITTFKPPDMVEFAVVDSGPGVDPEIRDHIFEPFVTTKRNGMGIGLAISRAIVERRGGQLRFDPNPDGGTIFSFTLKSASSVEDFDVG